MSSSEVSRTIRLASATSAHRVVNSGGVDYVVVPVIALVGDSAIHAVNARSAELVPFDELNKIDMKAWESRPCCVGHPVANGTQVSANTPDMLDKFGFGEVRSASIKGKLLTMEAWLNPIRAAAIGPHAVDIIERAKRNEMIEVSVGVHINAEEKTGVAANGVRYAAIWRNIRPDHLAILPAGHTGACSVKLGCGANRAASVNVFADGDFKEGYMSETRSLKERFLSFLKTAAAVSDTDMRDELTEALRASVPGFAYVHRVFPLDQQVVYCVCPIGPANYGMNAVAPDPAEFYRRSFDYADEDLTLNDDVEKVEQVEDFVAAEAAKWVERALSNPEGINQYTKGGGGGHDEATKKALDDLHKVNAAQAASFLADRTSQQLSTGKTHDGRQLSPKEMKGLHEIAAKLHRSAGEQQREVGATMKAGLHMSSAAFHENKLRGAEENLDEKNPYLKTACGCKHADATHTEQEKNEMDKTKAIDALITAGKFKESDRTFLATASEEQLRTLGAAEEKPEIRTLTEADVQTIAKNAVESFIKTCSSDPKKFMEIAPEEIRTLVENKKKDDAAEHAALVNTLKTAQKSIPEEQLKLRTLENLREIASLVSVPARTDYSGRIVTDAQRAAEEAELPPAPIDMNERIRTAAKKQ